MTEDTPLRTRLIVTVCSNLGTFFLFLGFSALLSAWLNTGGPL